MFWRMLCWILVFRGMICFAFWGKIFVIFGDFGQDFYDVGSDFHDFGVVA